MPFKGMDERFEQKMRQLYDAGSTKDGGPRGRNDEPYLEIKPYDPERNETTHDSRFLPIGSVKRDNLRIKRFLVSNKGLLFLGKQQTLQTGNVFSESRLINPLFVLGNIQPMKRIRRPLSTPASAPVRNATDASQLSPASFGNVGAAGRLQQHTSTAIIAQVTGTQGNGLLSFLNPANILSNLAGAFGIGNKAGTLGMNQRPELMMNSPDGQYFSILLWKGFERKDHLTPRGTLDRATAALQQGNFRGAIQTIQQGISTLRNDIRNIFSRVRNITGGRPTPFLDRKPGARYFITDANNADRYLKDSVGTDGSLNVGYLNRYPTPLTAPMASSETQVASLLPKSSFTANFNKVRGGFNTLLVNNTQQVGNLFATNLIQTLAQTANVASNPDKSTLDNNAAESHMLFQTLSLRSRYTEDQVVSRQKEMIDNQIKAGLEYWKKPSPLSAAEPLTMQKRGIQGGIKPGDELNPDAEQKVRFAGGMYFNDTLNRVGILDGTPAEVKDTIQAQGIDLINVNFYDYVNKKTIPFRAFISGITENVSPEVSDTRYIGRIERSIVYVGVNRELSFNLYVQAFSKSDMESVWDKINYITGLCYPAKYADGFMVPPLVKLTVGNFYEDQPGYLKAVSHQIEDNTSWELDEGQQVPYGVTMSITFSVIEKRQNTSQSRFYPVKKLGA